MDNTAENFYKTDNPMPETEENIFDIDTPEEALDGIALLVSMAKSGKIDPWNIDIVDVTDKYLIQMAEKKASNLKNTGRTIWLASVLLKLKSNVLVGLDPMDFDSVMAQENFEDYNDDFEADYSPEPVKKSNVVSIDEALKRRLSTRLNRKRTVTLQDLIKQLKFYEELDKKQALKNTLERAKKRARSYANFSAEDIVNLAHEEYIDKTVEKIKTKLEDIFLKSSRVELENLIEVGMDKISAYIALLFLSAETDIELVQKEFYGELYIQKGKLSENITISDKTELPKEDVDNTAPGKNGAQEFVDKNAKNPKFKAYSVNHSNIINAPPDTEVVIAS